jgi:hypothetical protein
MEGTYKIPYIREFMGVSMNLRITLFALLALAAQPSFADVATSTSSLNSAVDKKTEFSNSLQLGYFINKLGLSTEGAKSHKDIAVDPSMPDSFSLGWSNRQLGISLNANVADGRKQTDRAVSTTAQDYQLRYLKENFGVELIYQKYKGFNSSSASYTEMNFVSAQESALPSMEIGMYKAQLEWKFHGVGALEFFGPTWSKPKQDGAGYYLLTALSQVDMSNPTPIFPQSSADAYGDDATISKGTFQSLESGVGASYIWQWTRFYIGIYGGAQGGPQRQSYETKKGNQEVTKLVWSGQAKMVLGYDFNNWYLTAIFHTHPLAVELNDNTLRFFTQQTGISAGTRF